VSAARLTLAILRTEAGAGAGIERYKILPAGDTLSLANAARRLALADKPATCHGKLVGSVLEVECSELNEGDAKERLAPLAEVRAAYRQLLDSKCVHAGSDHQVQVLVGREQLVFPLVVVEAWRLQYEMPYSLPIWTRQGRTVPAGLCAVIDVRPALIPDTTIESHDHRPES
jgi:hypothetical protein